MTRRLATLASLAALTIPAPASAKDGCNARTCIERVARKQCSQSRPVPCIRRAALHYHQSFRDALRVARCESGLHPGAVSPGGHRGIYQFAWPGTWNTTPYRSRSVHSAKFNSLAAMWMWSRGRRGEWSCR